MGMEMVNLVKVMELREEGVVIVVIRIKETEQKMLDLMRCPIYPNCLISAWPG